MPAQSFFNPDDAPKHPPAAIIHKVPPKTKLLGIDTQNWPDAAVT